MIKNISILGSTGSIGCQTLEVARMHGYRVRGLSANNSTKLIEEQAREFCPEFVCLNDEKAYNDIKIRLSDTDIKILSLPVISPPIIFAPQSALLAPR